MSESDTGFYFSFSEEGMKLYYEGKAKIEAGGLKDLKGRFIELAKPVVLDRSIVDGTADDEKRAMAIASIQKENLRPSLTTEQIRELERNTWLQANATSQLYKMTNDGFQRTLSALQNVSSKIDRLTVKFDEKVVRETKITFNAYINKLNSALGYMKTKNFNATENFSYIGNLLDDVNSFLLVCHEDVINWRGMQDLNLCCICYLLPVYAEVVRNYSSLYYYENGSFPPNYDRWCEIIKNISDSKALRNNLNYYIRMNTDLPLEAAVNESINIMYGLKYVNSWVEAGEKYVLGNSKEEYLALSEQLRRECPDESRIHHIGNTYLIEVKQ